MNSENCYFETGLSLVDQKVFQSYIKHYRQLFIAPKGADSDLIWLEKLALQFSEEIKETFNKVATLRSDYQNFSTTLKATVSEVDKVAVIIEFITKLGSDDLKGDIKATRKWLDADASSERLSKQVSGLERKLKYLFDRVGYLVSKLLIEKSNYYQDLRWQALDLKSLYLRAFYYEGDHRVKHYAFESLTKLVNVVPIYEREKYFLSQIKQFIIRFSQDRHQSIELQQDSLTLLIKFSRESFATIAATRLASDRKDEFFVRAHIAKLICLYQSELAATDTFFKQLLADKSDYVRQTLASQLLVNDKADNMSWLTRIFMEDPNYKVRASALFSLAKFQNFDKILAFDEFTADFLSVLQAPELILKRSLLHLIPRIYSKLVAEQQTLWLKESSTALAELKANTENAAIRKWTSQSENYLWLLSDKERWQYAEQIKTEVQKLPLSKRKKIKLPILSQLSNAELGRLLSVLNNNDFPLDVTRRKSQLKVSRWYHFRFRLWRFLYEVKNSASDKRQAHRHLIGRVFYGNMSVPSAVLAEQTVTKVPGEPLFEPSEDGPRNYLPLVDELISCLDQSWPIKPLEIYSSDGITEVMPPLGLWDRFKVKIKLTRSFAEYAQMRNWTEGSQEAPNHYIASLRKLGFTINYRDYTAASTQAIKPNKTIGKFFSAPLLPFITSYWENLRNYFGSVYSNNLQHLLVFLIGLFSLFFIKHAWLNYQVNKARKDLPLSIGGWGTRGKSGTERLKAALFNGLGLNVISKTTGCEAMFLHGVAHGNLKEMFLFRPYDKATIWEQVNLLRLSTQLGADVFLWECMGLTPAYVHILQRHWMRDDFATITNTYPDHEDVQGPAGYDIPNVMVEFIPKNSTLITSEEVMYPILKNGADKLNSECHPVSWVETSFITDDILERFPYEEHPNNIALVVRLAQLMGINKDYALRSMADNVVLDLGVLKTYPESIIRNHTLQFVMGNSANERLGAMGNWTRMGFDKHDMQQDAKTWVTTLINNRADRVPRSKVFASMLVKDISADKHFLIGTNLDGFMKFLNEAWQEHYHDYSIWGSGEKPNSLSEALVECELKAKQLRIPYCESIIEARIKAMLSSLNIELNEESLVLNKEALAGILKAQQSESLLDEIWSFAEPWFAEYEQYQQLIKDLATDPKKANQHFIDFLQQALIARVVVVNDAMTPGEEIINLIADNTPLGLFNRIMGMQNIKGTGLDYVYRWQAWESCYSSAQKLFSKKQPQVAEGLQELRSFKEFGVLSGSYIKQVIEQVTERKVMQSELFQAELSEITYNLQRQMNTLQPSTAKAKNTSRDSWIYKSLVMTLERIIDIGDAVKRRKKANAIYEALASQRISHSRAAVELQALTKRQKGGWLWKSIKNKT